MTSYRAIVSITFDDDDLEEFAASMGVDPERLRPDDVVCGDLDNLSVGCGWLEQLFADGKPTIGRLSGGIQVEINPHD